MTDELVPFFQSDEVIPLHTALPQPVEPTRALIRAENDTQAVRDWLVRFKESPRTLVNCRKEAERLLLWSRIVKRMRLADLCHDDFIEYREFLAAPPESWISKTKFPRHDNRWRPFSKGLSPASVKQAEIVCNSMLNWLVSARYLQANPLALVNTRTRGKPKRVTRFLSGHQVVEILQTVATIKDPRKRVRCRWVFSLLYLTMGRISEAIGATMGDVYRKPSRNGSLWWLHVLGKGDKEGDIPVTDELLEELKAYRLFNGFPAMPETGEATPLILRLEGDRSKPITQSMLHRIIKEVVTETADRLKLSGNVADAESIRQSSAHWFRHSAASSLSYHVDMPSLRDILRHENVSTTSIYAHTEDEKLHDLMQKHHKLPTD